MPKDGSGVLYLNVKFPKLSEEKIQEGILVGPQIRQLIKNKSFEGNHNAENYKDLINELKTSYKALGCNMSLKIYILDSHLDFVPADLGAVSEEQGERFHQDISLIKHYQGKWSPGMLADNWRRLRKGLPKAKYSRKS